MDSKLLEIAHIFRKNCNFVLFPEFFLTKVRYHLRGEFVFDIFYRSTTGSYSYTLSKKKRVLGWDNTPHHPELPNYPHHFHKQDGGIHSSPLSGKPESDILVVAKEVNQFLKSHTTSKIE